MITRQTTKELLAASIRELARTHNIDKITIREIAQNCGLTSTTFYNHFQDKYALLAWIFNEEVAPLYDRLGEDITWNMLLRQGIMTIQRNQQFYRNILKNTSGQTSFRKVTNDYVITRVSQYICQRLGVTELPTKLQFMVRFYIPATLHFISDWVLNHDEPPTEEFIAFLEDAMPQELIPYLSDKDCHNT